MTNRKYIKLLKEILETSGWTQEQLAKKLGVSYVTVNAWINNRAKPQERMMERIRSLYMTTELEENENRLYVTVVGTRGRLQVGESVVLERDEGNGYDDEAVRVVPLDEYESEMAEFVEEGWDEPMFVANSVETVARGTWSAGRIYDKLEEGAMGVVEFTLRDVAIVRVTEV